MDPVFIIMHQQSSKTFDSGGEFSVFSYKLNDRESTSDTTNTLLHKFSNSDILYSGLEPCGSICSAFIVDF